MESSDRFIYVPDHHLSLLCSEFRRHFGNRYGRFTGRLAGMDWTCPKKFWSPLVSIYNTGFSLRAFSYESPLVEKEVLERRQYCKLETGNLYTTADFRIRPLSYNSQTSLIYTEVDGDKVTHSIAPHSFLHIVQLNWGLIRVGYAYDGRGLKSLESSVV
jgi:hypothetical protein